MVAAAMVMPDLESMDELDGVYSNCFHEGVDHEVASELKANPGKAYAQHAAYNFCGYVWFSAGQFHEQIWVHRRMVEVLSADEIEELIENANDQYGRE